MPEVCVSNSACVGSPLLDKQRTSRSSHSGVPAPLIVLVDLLKGTEPELLIPNGPRQQTQSEDVSS